MKKIVFLVSIIAVFSLWISATDSHARGLSHSKIQPTEDDDNWKPDLTDFPFYDLPEHYQKVCSILLDAPCPSESELLEIQKDECDRIGADGSKCAMVFVSCQIKPGIIISYDRYKCFEIM